MRHQGEAAHRQDRHIAPADLIDAPTIHEIFSEIKRAGLYLSVSQDSQTTENQRRILMEVAERADWTVVEVFEDAGFSGAKGRDKRPAFDALVKAVHRREIDLVAAFAVDRLGRSLPDLVSFLNDIQARGCDLYLHQQAVDTSTPSGRMLFQMLAVFSQFERAIITSRINAGRARARARGVSFGRPNLSLKVRQKVQKALADGHSIRQVAKITGVSSASVGRIRKAMTTIKDRQESVPA
ncbi:MAG TPA: recombinase family protein [Brevundimonas sp.]|uniref:recombinase family protein n=1 Tax=Brevundimonas sp. TaxID=1871086 RepID=UPI002625ADFF|nr:recombinase family protein [Brevundimonas sp.]HRO33536.1 recombinase family protein [Brevundimonas sp.]